MSILFTPLAAAEGTPGVLTRALAREIAAVVARAAGVKTVFRPFAHMVEGRRVFGVYRERWSREDLSHLTGGESSETEFLVHGDLDAGDPFTLTVEVLSVPGLLPVAEQTFEAPEYRGFEVVEQAARFIADAVGWPGDPEVLADFPAKTFDGYLRLLEGREAAASLDVWADPEDPAAVFEPYFSALEREPAMEAARTEICLVAASACVSGALPVDAAENAMRKLIAADRGEWRAFAALAQIQLLKGETAGAVASFHRALELEPGRSSLRFDLGMALLREERAGRAAKVLETVKTDPHVGARALFELGKIRAAKDDTEAALDLWRQSIEMDPEHAVVHARLGAALSSRGEFAEAEEVFRRGLRARWPACELHFALGAHQAEQDRYIDAVIELKNALRLCPEMPAAHLHLGRCYAAEGKKQPALHHLRRALDGPEEIAEAARKALGDLSSPEHEENLRKTLEDAVDRPPAEQVVMLKELLKVEAGFADARLRLGLALVAERKNRAAEGQFRKVLKAHPDDPQAWSGLATALRARKKLKAAVEAHREAIEHAPNHAPYHLNLADTLLRLGRTADAAAEVDVARSCDPHHPLLPNFVRAVKQRMTADLARPEVKK